MENQSKELVTLPDAVREQLIDAITKGATSAELDEIGKNLLNKLPVEEAVVPEKNELNKNSKGGTEQIMERLYADLPAELLKGYQIIPSRVRELKEDKHRVLYLHDLADDPEAKNAVELNGSWTRFHRLVFVSHWQRNQFLAKYPGIQYSRTTVIPNSIIPIPAHTKPLDGKINIIYHTTPHRGLNVLVAVFKKLYETQQDIHLDVYSSFEIYGWPERDEHFKGLFEEIKEHPGMTYHGFKPNSEVRDALQKAHIFAYPSVWPETSCIALIEAMSAGTICVHPDFAALPETAANWTMMYPWHEDTNAHAHRFMGALDVAIETSRQKIKAGHWLDPRLDEAQRYVKNFYNWEIRKEHWQAFLLSFKDEPTAITPNYKAFFYQA